MNKENKIITITTVCCILFLIAFTFLIFWLYTPIYVYKPPPCYSMGLNQTKLEDGYELRITGISPNNLKPTNLGWKIRDQDGITILWNNFPTKSGQESGTSDEYVTIVWFDNDQNNKLTINDIIYIYTNDKDLEGFEFRIGIQEDDWFDLISQTELS